MLGYVTYGSVRGQCPHGLHPTLAEAQRCLYRDQVVCRRRGGYSDRDICAVGEDGYLYTDDSCTSWVPGEGGRGCGAARYVSPG